MYTLMSNKQYYDAICSGTITNTEGINSERLGLGFREEKGLGEEALSCQVSSPHESHAFPCLGCGRDRIREVTLAGGKLGFSYHVVTGDI